ncbi:hypothetical protein, partial [Elstera litoralis]|uniref:hypothetical protein n=1 Tax=Elstera litoralis TaxID=552518 RepID=UPI001E3F7CEE
QGNIVLKAERESAFEKLGPVGDFFGGIINPVLTFISVCLLLLSIKNAERRAKGDQKRNAGGNPAGRENSYRC